MNESSTINPGYAAKEVDMALLYMKEHRENSIPQDSFREETLNELENFKLIKKLSNGNYSITKKGLYARQLGAFKYMQMKRDEDFFSDYSAEKYDSQKKLIQTGYFLALILLLILFVIYKEDFFR